MLSLSGFVVIHRSLLNWGWHSDPATGWLFINLILMASHAPSEWKGIRIERGQLVTGRKSLAEQTGLSERQIRTALEHLKSTGEVAIKATNKFSLITLVNYGKFQDISETATSKTASSLTNNRPATDHIVTIKQDKQDIITVADAPPAKKSKRFTPPTVEEVRAYCEERHNGIDAQAFVDHYAASGWMRGKTPIKDWKACVRTWERNRQEVKREGDPYAGYERF